MNAWVQGLTRGGQWIGTRVLYMALSPWVRSKWPTFHITHYVRAPTLHTLTDPRARVTVNEASVNLWRRVGFTEIGRVPRVARLPSSSDVAQPQYSDAIQFYYDLRKPFLERESTPAHKAIATAMAQVSTAH